MDDLICEFIAEAREMLAALECEVVAWEAAPHDRARLDAIFRFVHTVKGNSGFFDLPRLTALSHAAEDALADVRAGRRQADQALVSAVLAAVDRIGDLIEAVETGADMPPSDARLIAALAEGGEVQAAAPARASPARTVRLPVELLDRMMNGVSDLVLARNALARALKSGTSDRDAAEALERLSASVADVREAVTRTRMQRVESLFAPLPRMVRDICAETGKQVALRLDGQDVELDREMIELIRDPLAHMVRNAIGHGIEPPESRRAAGKPESGTLRIAACQQGNRIVIEIADDGRGIDAGALCARAVAAGLLTAAQAQALDLERRLALVFEPGLSTAPEVTSLSGRGVGMDVVRANVERIGGLIEVETRSGEGACFTLSVPLTLTIIPGFTVACGSQTFAIPRSAIEEIVRAGADGVHVERVAGAAVLTMRGRRVPILPLARLTGAAPGTDPAVPPPGAGREADLSAALLVLLKVGGGGIYALAVDHVTDHEELVVKPASPPLIATGLYAGTTLADDGRPVLLLDPSGLAAKAGISPTLEAEADDAEEAEPARPALLFTSFCGARRAVPLAYLLRVEKVPAAAIAASGGRLHVAIGDRLLPLAGCDRPPPAGTVPILRLSDGDREIAYAAAQIVDTVDLPAVLTAAARPGEVQGVALVGGAQVELLDLHWLFASGPAGAANDAERPLCLLAGADPWLDGFLRPLVESAGYRVRLSSEITAGEAPDLVILLDGSPDAAPAGSGRIVRLRSAAGAGDCIHRYDRAALLAALRRDL